jgi:hypothetical protein
MCLNELDKLFQEIIKCHNKHFIDGKCDLIKLDKAPNSNIIYHFYNDGEITSQKGGFAYNLRSEFTYKPSLIDIFKNVCFKLPIKLNENISYAILTESECNHFYNKFKLLI